MTKRTETSPPLFDPRAYKRLLGGVSFLRHWFEPSIRGLEHIPAEGGALFVTNHGHFGMDLPVLLSLVLDATGRPVRSLGDRLVFAAPFFRELAHKMGAIEGQPEAAVELLRDDQLVLVYPGGAKEALGNPEDAYRLQWEKSRGFIRTALRAGKPILPLAGIGNEEMYLQLVSQERVRETGVGRFISKLIGDKYVFPLYIGLGPIPFPTDLHYIVGEPIHLPYGPEAANDEEIVRALHREVTDATQSLIDQGLRDREKALDASIADAVEDAGESSANVLDDSTGGCEAVI